MMTVFNVGVSDDFMAKVAKREYIILYCLLRAFSSLSCHLLAV